MSQSTRSWALLRPNEPQPRTGSFDCLHVRGCRSQQSSGGGGHAVAVVDRHKWATDVALDVGGDDGRSGGVAQGGGGGIPLAAAGVEAPHSEAWAAVGAAADHHGGLIGRGAASGHALWRVYTLARTTLVACAKVVQTGQQWRDLFFEAMATCFNFSDLVVRHRGDTVWFVFQKLCLLYSVLARILESRLNGFIWLARLLADATRVGAAPSRLHESIPHAESVARSITTARIGVCAGTGVRVRSCANPFVPASLSGKRGADEQCQQSGSGGSQRQHNDLSLSGDTAAWRRSYSVCGPASSVVGRREAVGAGGFAR